MNTTFCTSGI